MIHAAVSCDHVFDVLTSGPFPRNQPGDGAVERHLAACHECRMLAESLRPALGLVHGACVEADLPAYRGALAAPGREQAAVWTVPVEDPRQRKNDAAGIPRRFPSLAGRCIAAAAAGCLLVAMLALGRNGVGFSPAGRGQAWGSEGRYQPTAAGLSHLASLGLPVACGIFPGEQQDATRSGASPTSTASLANIATTAADPHGGRSTDASLRFGCCMGCHSPAHKGRPPVSTLASLVSSCTACHAER